MNHKISTYSPTERNSISESPEKLKKNDLTLNFSLFLLKGKEVLEVQKELKNTIDFLKHAGEYHILPLTEDFLQVQEKEDNTLNFSFIIPDFELKEDKSEKEKIIYFLDNLLYQIKRNNKLQAFFTGGAVGEDLGILSSDIIYKAQCSDVCETVKAYVTGRENLEGFAKYYLEIVKKLKNPEFIETFSINGGMNGFSGSYFCLKNGNEYIGRLTDKQIKFLYDNNKDIFEKLQDIKEKQEVYSGEVNNLTRQLKKEAILKVANETLSWMYMLEQDHQIRLADFKAKLIKENQEMNEVDLSEVSIKEAVNDVLLSKEALKNQTYGRKMLYKLNRGGLNLYTKTFLHLHGKHLQTERKKIESQVKDMFSNLDNDNLDITHIFNILLESARKVEQDLSGSHFVGKVYSQGLRFFPKTVVKKVDFLLSKKEALENQEQQLKQAEERREKLFKNSQIFDMIVALRRGESPDGCKKAFETPTNESN